MKENILKYFPTVLKNNKTIQKAHNQNLAQKGKTRVTHDGYLDYQGFPNWYFMSGVAWVLLE